jgi:hypothetical protein
MALNLCQRNSFLTAYQNKAQFTFIDEGFGGFGGAVIDAGQLGQVDALKLSLIAPFVSGLGLFLVGHWDASSNYLEPSLQPDRNAKVLCCLRVKLFFRCWAEACLIGQ